MTISENKFQFAYDELRNQSVIADMNYALETICRKHKIDRLQFENFIDSKFQNIVKPIAENLQTIINIKGIL